MSNLTPEQRAREMLKRIANENSYETWADFVCDSHDQFLTDYTVKAMLEFATPEKEVEDGKVSIPHLIFDIQAILEYKLFGHKTKCEAIEKAVNQFLIDQLSTPSDKPKH